MQMQEELWGSSFCPELILCSHFFDYSFPKHRKRQQSTILRLPSVLLPLDQCTLCILLSTGPPAVRSWTGGRRGSNEVKVQEMGTPRLLRAFTPGRCPQEAQPLLCPWERLWEGFQRSVSTCPAHSWHREKCQGQREQLKDRELTALPTFPGTPLCHQQTAAPIPGLSGLASQRDDCERREMCSPFTQGLISSHYSNIMKIFIAAWIMPWNRYCAG